MDKRKLGNSGIKVSPLALGGNIFGWTIDEPTSFALLDAFVAAGFSLVDTADIYSRWAPGNQGGESETILGSWLKRSGKRDRIILATKVGMEMGPSKKGLSTGDFEFSRPSIKSPSSGTQLPSRSRSPG
jgi:aryl-alcohol dehydrogenase-like predicted oxidoreductase